MKAAPFLSLLALLTLGACGAPPSEPFPEETLAAWSKAFNAGDAAGVAALYAEDAVLMPPGAPELKGRAAIQEYLQAGFAQGSAQIELSTSALSVDGNTAVHRGTYVVRAPDGAPVEEGKFIEVWNRSADQWAMSADIWNSNAAPAPPAPPPAPDAPTPPG